MAIDKNRINQTDEERINFYINNWAQEKGITVEEVKQQMLVKLYAQDMNITI